MANRTIFTNVDGTQWEYDAKLGVVYVHDEETLDKIRLLDAAAGDNGLAYLVGVGRRQPDLYHKRPVYYI